MIHCVSRLPHFSLLLLVFFSGRRVKAQDACHLPFELAGGLIILEGHVRDQPGYFILDTGAGDLVLNTRYFGDLEQGLTDQSFGDVNQWGHRLSMGRADFRLGCILRKNEGAMLMDLQPLEQALGRPVHGIVGTEFFRDLELELDYAGRQVSLYRLDRQGRRLEEPARASFPIEAAPFRWKGHIPSIAVRIGGQELRMGLDTGAEINVLEEKWKTTLAANLEENGPVIRVRGVGRETGSGKVYSMTGLRLGQIEYPAMKTLVVSQLAVNEHLPAPWLDGLLGYEFLSRHRLSVNFRSREVVIRELRRAATTPSLLVGEENGQNRN